MFGAGMMALLAAAAPAAPARLVWSGGTDSNACWAMAFEGKPPFTTVDVHVYPHDGPPTSGSIEFRSPRFRFGIAPFAAPATITIDGQSFGSFTANTQADKIEFRALPRATVEAVGRGGAIKVESNGASAVFMVPASSSLVGDAFEHCSTGDHRPRLMRMPDGTTKIVVP